MTTCHCGATWTGHRIEHCTACHETFTGTRPGDMHRVGRHELTTGPTRRRCLRGPIPGAPIEARSDEHPCPGVPGHPGGGEAPQSEAGR